jgi:hypothetical protein
VATKATRAGTAVAAEQCGEQPLQQSALVVVKKELTWKRSKQTRQTAATTTQPQHQTASSGHDNQINNKIAVAASAVTTSRREKVGERGRCSGSYDE